VLSGLAVLTARAIQKLRHTPRGRVVGSSLTERDKGRGSPSLCYVTQNFTYLHSALYYHHVE